MKKLLFLILGFLPGYQIVLAQNLTVDLGSDSLNTCLGSVVFFQANIQGGVGPFTISWSTGDSTVDILYQSTQLQDTLWVLVEDQLGAIATDSLFINAYPECVWPGDANGDGSANNSDVLYLGRAYDAHGFIRPNAHTNWIGQPAPSWQHVFSSGVNYVHSDTDGDGDIDMDDFEAIRLNYLNPQSGPGNSIPSPTGIPLYLDLPSGNVNPGDTVEIAVMLGSAGSQADSIYGLSFSIQYDNFLIDSGSVQVSYHNSSLGTRGLDMEAVDKDFYDFGQLDIGMTRIDKNSVLINGKIATITVLIDDLSGKKSGIEMMSIEIKRVSLMKKDGTSLNVELSPAQFGVALSETSLALSPDFKLFPNPTSDQIYIDWGEAMPGQDMIMHILDIYGKPLSTVVYAGTQRQQIDMSRLACGLYFLKFESSTVKAIRKFRIDRP